MLIVPFILCPLIAIACGVYVLWAVVAFVIEIQEPRKR